MTDTVLFLHGPMLYDTRLCLTGLSDFAARHGWQVQHAVPPQNASPDYLAKLVAFWHPVGIVATYGHDKGIPRPNPALDVPFVCVDIDLMQHDSALSNENSRRGYVNCDAARIAELAARALLEQQFASYAYVSAYAHYHWCEARRQRFAEVLELNGRACNVFDGTGISSSSAASMRRLGKWLNELPKPCGLLAANDRTAVCVLSAAARAKVAVPDELSVLGVDDNEAFCETASPPLSSIRNDFRQSGVLAGELMLALSRRRKPQVLQAVYGADTLVRRLSTRKLVKTSPSVRLALETIRRRAADGISAADILPLLGGSRRSAEKRFRAAVGKSILEEILDVRFERLEQLLSETIPLGQLASRTGFTSENHLQRMFKARYGMTLSAWRKAHAT